MGHEQLGEGAEALAPQVGFSEVKKVGDFSLAGLEQASA